MRADVHRGGEAESIRLRVGVGGRPAGGLKLRRRKVGVEVAAGVQFCEFVQKAVLVVFAESARAIGRQPATPDCAQPIIAKLRRSARRRRRRRAGVIECVKPMHCCPLKPPPPVRLSPSLLLQLHGPPGAACTCRPSVAFMYEYNTHWMGGRVHAVVILHAAVAGRRRDDHQASGEHLRRAHIHESRLVSRSKSSGVQV